MEKAAAKRSTRAIREDLVTQACLEAYGQVRHEARLADRSLDFTLRHKANLYSQERREVAERVYALLRQQRTVDHLLERSRPGFAGLSASRQDLLRLCASRVLHGEALEAVATSTALMEADRDGLFALPEAARELETLPPRERFAIAASLPDFLAERFWNEFGREAEPAAAALNERAPLSARVNALKIDRDSLLARLKRDGVDARPTALSPLGLILETRINAYSLPAFREGLFEIQDEGSQLLGMLVDAPPTHVVDACAGAGGKTLQLAAQMKNRGDLYAMDIDERRLDELRRRARRASVHNVRVQLLPRGEEARPALEPFFGRMDRVLVDAPCSGTGTFRRKPDARYRLTEGELAAHVVRQKSLLAAFAPMVKHRGRLIYGTCSVLREENEAVIEEFLESHSDFERRPVAERLGEPLAKTVSRDGYLRLYPHRHGTDGFFGALLERVRP